MSENNRSQIPLPPVQPGGQNEVAAPAAAPVQPIAEHDPIKTLRARKGPIEVIALTAGLYKNQRIAKGTQFRIEKPEHLGSWMRCVDRTIQTEHEHYVREHKKKMFALERKSAGD